MTYHRLFHILLVGSTLVLAVVWWSSLRHYRTVAFPVGDMMEIGLASGTISLFHAPPSGPNHFVKFSSVPIASRNMTDRQGHPLSPVGRFHLSEIRLLRIFHVEFPVWVPYLVFIASAFALTRHMEKRSGPAKETRLAEQQAHPVS